MACSTVYYYQLCLRGMVEGVQQKTHGPIKDVENNVVASRRACPHVDD